MAQTPTFLADETSLAYFELADRWIHFLAGVIWIGLLYFFNWVNSAFAPTLDAETKRKVVPELLPRALWWFRWGALVTWLSGFFLLFLVYYHGYEGSNLIEPEFRTGELAFADWAPGLVGLFVGFVLYELVFLLFKNQHGLGVLVWGLLAVGFAGYLHEFAHFGARATYIHVGALFGTAMAANVWMRIWPAQRRIINAVKNGQAPDPKDPAVAGLRSKHNTYMSVPLLLLMVSVHQPVMLSAEWYVVLPAVLLVGLVATRLLYAQAPRVRGM